MGSRPGGCPASHEGAAPGLGRNRSQASRRKLTDDDDEFDRARRREKNRIAARESRARKLQCLTNLQTDVATLQAANGLLRQRIEEVTRQASVAQLVFAQLRDQVLRARLACRPEDQAAIDSVLAQALTPVEERQAPPAAAATASDSPGGQAARGARKRQRGPGVSSPQAQAPPALPAPSPPAMLDLGDWGLGPAALPDGHLLH